MPTLKELVPDEQFFKDVGMRLSDIGGGFIRENMPQKEDTIPTYISKMVGLATLPFGGVGSKAISKGFKVFHGSFKKLNDIPDIGFAGLSSGIKNEGAVWVTPSKKSAQGFAEVAAYGKGKPVVNEYHFNPRNPMTINIGVMDIVGDYEKIKVDAIKKAKDMGHDSIIFKMPLELGDEIAILNPKVLSKGKQ